MITRDQYMDNSNELHHEYYLQFATLSLIKAIPYDRRTIKRCLAEDKNLNNLPGRWVDKLDHLTLIYKSHIASVNLKITGQRAYSLCDGTCAFKAIMREMAQGKTAKQIIKKAQEILNDE